MWLPLLVFAVSSAVAFQGTFPRLRSTTCKNLAIVDVNLPDRSYPIYIGTGLLSQRSDNPILKHVTSKKALIVTNTKVGPLYSQAVRTVLESAGK
jgi:hypothetical protein